MVRWFWLIGVAMLIAGCDSGAPPTKTKSITAANPYQDRLTALGDLDRSLALRRAVQDSGQPCKKIEASAYQGTYKSLHMWTARCSQGKDWSLFIAPNGDVQVRSCAHLKQLGLPECRLEQPAT